MIDGVVLRPLKRIKDARGEVMHMLRADAPDFRGFGEIYFSVTNPGVVKAWKRHKRVTGQLAAVSGRALFVLYDGREDSRTKGQVWQTEIGGDDYCLLVIPPRVTYGWKALDDKPLLLANCSTEPHDPAESENLPWDAAQVPHRW